MESGLRISLRELLLVVVCAGIGLASLRLGGVIASAMILAVIVLAMALAIMAFVGRDQLQALAIGFLIPVVAYAAVVLAIGTRELDPYGGKLPTSRLLRPMFTAIVERTWTDLQTGQFVPDYDPNDPKFANRMVGSFQRPDRQMFMALGHVLWAMVFGYAGAKFAVAVYRRQRGSRPSGGEQGTGGGSR